MNENQAYVIIRNALIKGLRAYGYTKTKVLAGRQPTKQLPLDDAVYFFSIGEERQGVQGRKYTKLAPGEAGDVGHVERVRVSKTVQIQCFRKQDIKDAASPTASDLCAIVKMILDSLPFQEEIRLSGVAVHNTTPIREPEFVNDAGDYEKQPSFDFDMGFTREIHPLTPELTTLTADVSGA